MTLPRNEYFPDDPEQMPPARRRRAHRLLIPLDVDERAEVLDRLALRTTPTFDFFIFSLLSGAVIGLGLLADAPALLVLGAVLAPLMTPSVGVSLGTVTGSFKLFARSLAALLIGAGLVFAVGALSGLVAQLALVWLPLEFNQLYLHAQISWPNFVVLAFGAVWTAAAVANSGRNAALPSVAQAYVLYVPLVVAGFGLTSGIPHLWPDGLVIYAVYLAWATLLGAVTLAIKGFRPLTLFGYTLGGALTLLGILLLIGISGVGAIFTAQVAVPTPIPTSTATPTPRPTLPPPPTVTATPLPPTLTPTLTLTPIPTPTLTNTPLPSPTPMYALVNDKRDIPYPGAILRAEPGFSGTAITTLLNGTLVQVLETREVDGNLWARVSVPSLGIEGWVIETLLLMATPAPSW